MKRTRLALGLWMGMALGLTFQTAASKANAQPPAPPAPSEALEFTDKGEADPRLEGAWKLVSVDGQAPPTKKLWPRDPFVVHFDAGEVTGAVACNGFFGPYRVKGDQLESAPGQTTLACISPIPDEWDEVTMRAIQAAEITFGPDAGRLTLRTSDGRAYVFRRLP